MPAPFLPRRLCMLGGLALLVWRSAEGRVECNAPRRAAPRRAASRNLSTMSSVRFLVRRHPSYPLAKIPTRGSSQAAGYDLYAAEDAVIPKGGRAVVQTGISIAIPVGHYGRVAPRSGLGMYFSNGSGEAWY